MRLFVVAGVVIIEGESQGLLAWIRWAASEAFFWDTARVIWPDRDKKATHAIPPSQCTHGSLDDDGEREVCRKCRKHPFRDGHGLIIMAVFTEKTVQQTMSFCSVELGKHQNPLKR